MCNYKKVPCLLFSLVFFRVAFAFDSNFTEFNFNEDFLKDGQIYNRNSNSSESPIFKISKNAGNSSAEEPILTSKDHLPDFLKVYDVRAISRVWHYESGQLTLGCRQNMYNFLKALENYDLWALKGKIL